MDNGNAISCFCNVCQSWFAGSVSSGDICPECITNPKPAYITYSYKTLYVLGFLFDPDHKQVALIQKTRPDWQKGLLNGIGGKIESGETSIEAISREFKEEAGLDIKNWEYKLSMESSTWIVDVYRAESNEILNVTTLTEEIVQVIHINSLNEYPIVPNLKWLIPLCLDNEIAPIHIIYHS